MYRICNYYVHKARQTCLTASGLYMVGTHDTPRYIRTIILLCKFMRTNYISLETYCVYITDMLPEIKKIIPIDVYLFDNNRIN